MSWLSSLIGGGKNPANSANDYLSKIPGAMSPYYQPYIQGGQEAGKQLTDQYSQLTQNPGDFYAKMGQGYKESPGYQYKLQQALGAGQNAAAAGGQLGLPQDQQQQMETANNISSQDYDQYMQHVMDLFGLGQQGQQKMQQQGFDASTGYGQNLGNVLGTQGQYAFAGQAGQNANRSNMMSNLLKAGGAGLGWLAGGPVGGLLGGGLGSSMYGGGK